MQQITSAIMLKCIFRKKYAEQYHIVQAYDIINISSMKKKISLQSRARNVTCLSAELAESGGLSHEGHDVGGGRVEGGVEAGHLVVHVCLNGVHVLFGRLSVGGKVSFERVHVLLKLQQLTGLICNLKKKFSSVGIINQFRYQMSSTD